MRQTKIRNLVPNTTLFGEYPLNQTQMWRGHSLHSIKTMAQMHIDGSPTLGSDALYSEYSLIMKEPLSALCFLVMIPNLNLMISWHFEFIKHNSKQVHILDICQLSTVCIILNTWPHIWIVLEEHKLRLFPKMKLPHKRWKYANLFWKSPKVSDTAMFVSRKLALWRPGKKTKC